jgi:3beta-hydroxysteroid-4beta-carboxylate 3-dehydrogenase (decarboxylating)
MLLVTGGTGHLGANLVRRLLADGHAVRVLLRHGSDRRALDGLDLERVHGDLRDPPSLAAAVAGCDRVYHCAAVVSTIAGDARHKRQIYDSNVLGTRNLLQAARAAGVARVVVTGSFSAVGHDPSRPSDETIPFYPFDRAMPYEVSKVFVEHECLKAVAEGLDIVIATSCAILGPNDFRPSRMGAALCDFANGTLRAYIPGGFEFVSAADIVQGHILAMEKGRPGQRYIFSTQFVTLDELMEIFEQVTGHPRPRLRLPAPLMAGISEITSAVLTHFFPRVPQRLTPGAVRILRLHRRADCAKARRELGYQPTGIVDAVRQAYEFFVREGRVPRPGTVGP